MRRAAVGGLVLVVLAGLSTASAAAPDEDDVPPKKSAAPQPSSSWSFRHLFGLNDKQTTKKPVPEKTAAKKPDAPAPGPAVRDAAAERQREEKALQRRLAVILKLQEVALETNDVELARLADQLDERVWSVYLQRTASLPAGRATFETDERILDRHLGPGPITGRPAPALPRTAGGVDRSSRASAGEEKR